jgi:hypothetical protein
MTGGINLLVEGHTDEVILHRLLAYIGLQPGTTYGKNGKAALLQHLPSYNHAARYYPWIVVVDLEQDAECAPDYMGTILPEPAPQMCLRIAVRAIEAWLLADAEHLAAFLRIPRQRVPVLPEAEVDPKTTLVRLARFSRSRAIREDMVLRAGSGAKVGRGYVGRLIEFVASDHPHAWRPAVAAEYADSLRRCLDALHGFRETARS